MSFVERHAWKVFTVLGGIVVLFGAGDIASGGASLQSGEAVLFNSMTGTTWDELQAANPAPRNSSTTCGEPKGRLLWWSAC